MCLSYLTKFTENIAFGTPELYRYCEFYVAVYPGRGFNPPFAEMTTIYTE